MKIMRHPFYKAKRTDNGKEAVGFYWENGFGKHFIRQIIDEKGNFCTNDIEIDFETLSQYVGEFYGHHIWERDMIRCYYKNSPVTGVVTFGYHSSDNQANLGFYIDWGDNKYGMGQDLGYLLTIRDFEVIGNTFGGKQNG